MKKSVRFWTLLLCLLLLTGCLGGLPAEDTLALSRKGGVTRTVVEDFDKDFYDEAELLGEIEEELADYNKNFGTDHLKLKKFQVKDGVATLQLQFDEAKYYADYAGVILFDGTTEEAEAQGYDLSGEYMDAEGSLTDVQTATGDQEARVLVLEEAVTAEVPGSILCVSREGNVEITGKHTAKVKEEGRTALIVYH